MEVGLFKNRVLFRHQQIFKRKMNLSDPIFIILKHLYEIVLVSLLDNRNMDYYLNYLGHSSSLHYR